MTWPAPIPHDDPEAARTVIWDGPPAVAGVMTEDSMPTMGRRPFLVPKPHEPSERVEWEQWRTVEVKDAHKTMDGIGWRNGGLFSPPVATSWLFVQHKTYIEERRLFKTWTTPLGVRMFEVLETETKARTY